MNFIITGASRGLGAALAKIGGAQNNIDRLFLISRDQKKLQTIKGEIERLSQNTLVDILALDITVTENINDIYAYISDKVSSVDVLINNAGMLVNADFSEVSCTEIDSIFRTNYLAPSHLIQKFLPLLKMAPGPHVVNIGSMGGVQGSVKFPGLAHYSASKGALAILTECLAEEYKSEGISFNYLALGAVQTEMLEEAFPGYKAPLGAMEMAEFVLDFALNGHKYFNGKIIPLSTSTP